MAISALSSRTYYSEHVRPVIHADPEWQKLMDRETKLRAQVDDLKRQLESVTTARINLEGKIAAPLLYRNG